jgi:L-alanine-DL-glutamate epimerase-like enolase superfamily enzyme
VVLVIGDEGKQDSRTPLVSSALVAACPPRWVCRAWRPGRTACYDAVVKVTSLEVFVLDFPVKAVFVLVDGVAASPGALSPRVLVKVTADDGAWSWGEATPTPRWTYETTETIVSTLRGCLAPAVVGLEACETTFLRERLWKGGGRVILPEGPGLGVEVDETYVRRHAVAVRMP